MLVLSRKSGETIRIGDDITIRVQTIKGNRVQIAVEAPSDHKILRGELLELRDERLTDEMRPLLKTA